MSQQKCLCNSGLECWPCYLSRITKSDKTLSVCQSYYNTGQCSIISCGYRHMLTTHEKEMKDQVIAKEKKENKDKLDRIRTLEILEQSTMGIAWRDVLLKVYPELSKFMPNSLISLIGKYISIDENHDNGWFYIFDHADIFFDTCLFDDVCGCSNCLYTYCHDMWIIINECNNVHLLGIKDENKSRFRYRPICRDCAAFDFDYNKNKYHLRGPKGNDPIWISDNYRPIVNWNDEPSISLSSDNIIPNNDIARLKFVCANEKSWIVPLALFERNIGVNKNRNILKLLNLTEW